MPVAVPTQFATVLRATLAAVKARDGLVSLVIGGLLCTPPRGVARVRNGPAVRRRRPPGLGDDGTRGDYSGQPKPNRRLAAPLIRAIVSRSEADRKSFHQTLSRTSLGAVSLMRLPRTW